MAYTAGELSRMLEWAHMPGDMVFIFLGVVPIAIAAVRAWLSGRARSQSAVVVPALS